MEDIEKGVETAELWVERLRIAAVEHYSKHHVPQDLKMQKKTVDYVKQNITQSGSVSSEDQDLNPPNNEEPMVIMITKWCPLNHSTLKWDFSCFRHDTNMIFVTVQISDEMLYAWFAAAHFMHEHLK